MTFRCNTVEILNKRYITIMIKRKTYVKTYKLNYWMRRSYASFTLLIYSNRSTGTSFLEI